MMVMQLHMQACQAHLPQQQMQPKTQERRPVVVWSMHRVMGSSSRRSLETKMQVCCMFFQSRMHKAGALQEGGQMAEVL
jgi:hypothetical protein